jgi:hypothetical protein
MFREMKLSLMRRAGLWAGLLFCSLACWGTDFVGPTNEIVPSATVTGASTGATSASNELTGSSGQLGLYGYASPSYSLAPGYPQSFPRPGKVQDLAAAPSTGTSLGLTFTAPGLDGSLGQLVSGTNFYVQYSTDSADTFDLAFTQALFPCAGANPGSAQSETVTGLLPNSTFFLVLWTRDADGRVSEPSNQAAGATLANAVSGVALDSVSQTSVTVSWTPLPAAPASASAEGYRLEASTSNFAGGVVFSSQTASVAVATLTVSGLTNGVTYYLRVGSLNWSGAADYSAVFSAVTGGSAGPNPPVINTAATFALSTTSVQLAWSYSGTPVTGFRVLASTGGPLSTNLPPSASSFVVAGLTPNLPLSAFVEAFSGAGVADSTATLRYTLADAPTSLAVTSVGQTSVSLSWSVNANPAGTVFALQRAVASTGPFATEFDLTASPYTDNSVAESATYFYRIAAKNGDGLDTAFNGPISTATLTIPPGVLTAFNAVANTSTGQRIDLSWTNPGDPDLAGVLIVRSTVPVAFAPQQYVSYSVGQAAGNGVVAYFGSAAPQSFSDIGLANFATYYYLAFARDAVPNYSPSAASSAYALPAISAIAPDAVSGITVQPGASTSTVVVKWTPDTTKADHSTMYDLVSYQLLRSPLLGGATDLAVTLPSSNTSYIDAYTGALEFYQVVAVDFSGNVGASAQIVSNEAASRTFFTGDSAVVQFGSTSAELLAKNNSTGRDLFVVIQRQPQFEGGAALRAFQTYLVDAASGARVTGVRFNGPPMTFAFSYGSSTAPPVGLLAAPPAAGAFGPAVFFNNGVDWMSIGGTDNPVAQAITVQSPNLGAYQVRQSARATGFSFDPNSVRPRIFTPNGDGKNDKVFFFFNNPNNSDVKIRIMDIRGGQVAQVTQAGPFPGISLAWDGTDSSGRKVPPGIYVYRVDAEDHSYKGTVVVAR